MLKRLVTRLTHLFRWPDPQAMGDLPVLECDGIKIALHPQKHIFALFLGSMHLSFDRAKISQSWHGMEILPEKPSTKYSGSTNYDGKGDRHGVFCLRFQ